MDRHIDVFKAQVEHAVELFKPYKINSHSGMIFFSKILDSTMIWYQKKEKNCQP